MMRRPRLGISFCTLVAALLVLAGPATADASSRSACNPTGSRTIAKSRTARVFTSRELKAYGCLYRRGRSFFLDYNEDLQGISGVSLAGSYAGFEFTVVSSSGNVSEVRVVDLRTGRRKRSLSRTTTAGGASPHPGDTEPVLYDLTVSSSGSVAWIDEVQSFVLCPTQPPPPAYQFRTCPGEKNIEVRALGPGDTSFRVLDSGPGIAKTSLHRRGRSIYWFHDGQRRSAQVR